MIKIGKQLYADNFPARALARKELVGWECESCHRTHGQKSISGITQIPLKVCKVRNKRKARKIVVIAHHPNYDTLNPDAELVILCRACHGKAQSHHNRQAIQKAVNDRKIANIEAEKASGQQVLLFDEQEYTILQINFPVLQFMQTISSVQ